MISFLGICIQFGISIVLQIFDPDTDDFEGEGMDGIFSFLRDHYQTLTPLEPSIGERLADWAATILIWALALALFGYLVGRSLFNVLWKGGDQ